MKWNVKDFMNRGYSSKTQIGFGMNEIYPNFVILNPFTFLMNFLMNLWGHIYLGILSSYRSGCVWPAGSGL